MLCLRAGNIHVYCLAHLHLDSMESMVCTIRWAAAAASQRGPHLHQSALPDLQPHRMSGSSYQCTLFTFPTETFCISQNIPPKFISSCSGHFIVAPKQAWSANLINAVG